MKWIKCSERLPAGLKDNAIQLVIYEKYFPSLAYYQDGEWIQHDPFCLRRKLNDVSYWMPIPDYPDGHLISDDEDTQP